MMNDVPEQLKRLAEEAHAGKRRKVPVRTLLLWFGSERRGVRVRQSVDAALTELSLRTEPDFRYVYIDTPITFVPSHIKQTEKRDPDVERGGDVENGESCVAKQAPPDSADAEDPLANNGHGATSNETIGAETSQGTIAAAAAADPALSAALADPTYRIGKLTAANQKPIYVSPNTTIEEALTTMLVNDFSQLPVMTSDREVKGLVSWKTIASSLGLKQGATTVKDCMGPHHEVSEDDSLFTAIAVIATHESVLVRAKNRQIIGIVTTTDLALTFDQLGEPFLILGEIENLVRSLLSRLTIEEIRSVRDENDPARVVESVADLTFGDYVRILENPSNWSKLGLRIDRQTFVKELQRVREIRNDVMHFDPEGLGPGDLAQLRRVGKFMQLVRDLNRTG